MKSTILPKNIFSVDVQVVSVTPDMAREWLARNTQNRHLSQKRVKQYARDMKAGRWLLTNQAIGFDVDGLLSDGQHRLYAVIEADVPVEMLVVTNLDPRARGKIDTGRARTPGDMLAVMEGTKNAQQVASIAKAAVAWDKGFRWFDNYDPTHQEIHAYVMDPANGLLHRAAEIGSMGRKYVSIRPTLLGLAFYVCGRIDYPDAEQFYVEQLIEGIGLVPGDPAKTLHKRLIVDAEKKGVGADFNKLAYVLTAWNKFRSGEKITKLQSPAGNGWVLANYPQPK